MKHWDWSAGQTDVGQDHEISLFARYGYFNTAEWRDASRAAEIAGICVRGGGLESCWDQPVGGVCCRLCVPQSRNEALHLNEERQCRECFTLPC